MTQSIARLTASGALILIAFGVAVPAHALRYCRTAHQFCFANGEAGGACSCADKSGTVESGVIVDAPAENAPPSGSRLPEATYDKGGIPAAPGNAASGPRDTVERAGASSNSAAGSMFGPGSGGPAGPSNSTTGQGRHAPATISAPPPPGITPQSVPTLAPSRPVPPAANAQAANQVRTTRSFFGPHDIPPENFGAYGIVAFPQKATPATIRRHQSICEAFLATLPPVSASGAPISQQMVTVWPIDDASLAERLNKGSDAICSQAIEHYDLSTGLIALKEAQNQEHYSLSGQGPYLLAWAPSSQKGKVGSIVLIADLSGATTQEQYLDYFQSWRRDIEQNPQLWPHGWSEAALLIVVRNWADKWGTMILSIGHAQSED